MKQIKNKPKTDMGKDFDKELKNFNIKIDESLNEKKQSLKRKIFSLDKMEALVHGDPKLSVIYQKMAEDGREKYGYHYNETIMNIIFNDYVLHSPKYLQKYKMAIPKKKKRRDRSGIEQLKKDITGVSREKREKEIMKDREMRRKRELEQKTDENQEIGTFSRYGKGPGNVDYSSSELFENKKNKNTMKKMTDETVKTSDLKPNKSKTPKGEFTGEKFKGKSIEKKADIDEEIDESTTSASSGQYATKFAFSPTGEPMRKPFWRGGVIVGEGKYLTNPETFKEYYNYLNEEFNMTEDHLTTREEKIDFISTNMNHIKNIEKTLYRLGDDEIDRLYFALEKKLGLVSETELSIVDQPKNDSMSNKPEPLTRLGQGVDSGVSHMNEHHLNTKEDKIEFISKAFKKITNVELPKITKRLLKKETEDSIHTSYLKMEELLKSKGIDPLSLTLDENQKINEKAKSKAQQRFMGVVRGVQKGDIDTKDVSKKVKKTAKEMDPDDVKDFASTKTDKLPEKIDETKYSETDWVGVDADLNISLFEYGVVAKQPEERDYDDEWFVLYSIGNNHYDTGWLREEEIDSIVKGNSWASTEDIDRMLEYTGTNLEKWLKMDFINKLYDLISYWGYESIMGTSYHPLSKKEAEKWLNNESIGVEKERGGLIDDEILEIDSIIKETERVLDEIGYYRKKSLEEEKNKNMKNNVTENKKTPSMVSKERLGKENQKNFKSDLQLSGTKGAIDAQKNLQHMDQQTKIDDPKKFSEDIEKDVLKKTKGEAFKNVGDSANLKGDEIPKRNHTADEKDEVDKIRKGQEDWEFDNEPGERFKERMKKQMGDDVYEKREKKREYRKSAPQYNKDSQPVFDGDEKEQYDKHKISESIITGLYFNDFGKRKLVEFTPKDTTMVDKVNESWIELQIDGLGNTYNSRVELNESLVTYLRENKFYINLENGAIHFIENKKNIVENEEKEVKLNESILEKMKHLSGYNPKTHTDTRNTKLNRGF